jgi:membrane-bound serine protease (ClpP class)
MGWGKIPLLILLLCATAFAAPTTAPGAKAVVIHIDGQINDYSRDMLAKRLAEARKLGADTVILDLNTFGGAVTSGLEMSATLKRSTDLHTIAYVQEKAISAGTMIALACDEIVMGPYAKIGDAAPISIGPAGLEPLPATERAKVASPVLADFTDSARRNGYSELLVEAMVQADIAVYWIQDTATAEKRFVNQAEYDKLMATGHWKPVDGVRNPIDSENTLLTVSTDLALKLGLAKATANDAASLANQRQLTILADFGTTTGEAILGWMNSAGVRFVLFVIFIMSLYIALHVPGVGGAEAVAVASLAALIIVPLMTGYAQWWEIAAILVGLALIAFEVFVFPGHGVSLLVGGLLVLFGFLMTFVPKEPNGTPGFLPSMATTWSAIETGLIVIVSGLAVSIALMIWLRKYLPKLPLLNRVLLQTPAAAIDAADVQSEWPAIGTTGFAATDLRPGGSGKFIDPATGDQRFVSVISDRGYVGVGTAISVQEVGGGRIVVREVKETEPA